MRRTFPLILLTATLAPAGCQSHESKVSDLQKQYDQLGAHFSGVAPSSAPEADTSAYGLLESPSGA